MRAPFSAAQAQALEALVNLWKGKCAFVLVGASALHCHRPNARGTEDLDIALAVAMGELPLGLDDLDGWRRHPRNEQEWIGPDDVRLDVLPAGPSLTAQGYVDWPSGHRMNLAGFEHVFSHNRPIEVGPGVTIAVADLAAIALLKMVAYLDRGAEREHDLQDIAFIIDEYMEDDDDRLWSDEVVDRQVPYDLVGSFLLGRDLAKFASVRDRANVRRFLALARDGRDSTMARLVRLAPTSWGRTEDAALERLAQFEGGFATEGCDAISAREGADPVCREFPRSGDE